DPIGEDAGIGDVGHVQEAAAGMDGQGARPGPACLDACGHQAAAVVLDDIGADDVVHRTRARSRGVSQGHPRADGAGPPPPSRDPRRPPAACRNTRSERWIARAPPAAFNAHLLLAPARRTLQVVLPGAPRLSIVKTSSFNSRTGPHTPLVGPGG